MVLVYYALEICILYVLRCVLLFLTFNYLFYYSNFENIIKI